VRRLDRIGGGGEGGARRLHARDGQLGPLAVSPAIYKNLPYDPVKSFAPVSLMAMVPSVLVVNPQVPVASAGELIAYARANPGKLTYGSAGSGSTSHLTTEYFKLATGTDILHVPYKGVGPMLTDLISDSCRWDQRRAGGDAAREFGRLARARGDGLDAPAVAAADPDSRRIGRKGFRRIGLVRYPRAGGTAREIVMKLNAEIRRIMQTPELRTRLDNEGAIPRPARPRNSRRSSSPRSRAGARC